MKTLHYIIADLDVLVTIPDSWDESRLLPSLGPFLSSGAPSPRLAEKRSSTVLAAPDCNVQSPAIRFTATKELARPEGAELIDTFENEAGIGSAYKNPDGGWTLEVHFGDGNINRAVCNADFSQNTFWLNPACKKPVTAASTLMRSCFAQRLLYFDGISMHSSTVKCGGKGYMFLGKSGTGKSTHSRLWLKNFPGSILLNDDNPMVRKIDGEWRVYGSPWSGKTSCYVNDSAPLKGIVRLSQAPENKFTSLSGIQAWIALYPSCSIIRQDRRLNDLLTASLNALAVDVAVGSLECLPDDDAALTCKNNLD